MNTTTPTNVHHGRNIKRLREMLGIKQEAIAIDLDITQQAVSDLEKREEIDTKTLNKIAKILKVPVEAIKNMNEGTVYNYINTFYDNSIQQYNYNPIDKIIELYTEKTNLLEKMLKEKEEKISLLEKLLNEDK